jgi:hypothetical protein
MSYCRNSRMSAGSGAESPWGCHGHVPWKPLELVAMILGFIVFWPIGLAIVFWKIWQRKSGYEGDLFSFAQQQASRFQQGASEPTRASGGSGAPQGWRGPSFMRSSGNVAFDEWREAELARLEEERRKLAEAERDFSDHIDQLRRAKDREEFDSFMRARKGGSQSAG